MKAEGVIQIAFMRAAMRELVRQAKVRLPQLTPEEGRKELEQDIELLESTLTDNKSNQHQAAGLVQLPFLKTAVRELIRNAKVRLPQMEPEDGGDELCEDIELLQSILI
jgi:hypothetical protein